MALSPGEALAIVFGSFAAVAIFVVCVVLAMVRIRLWRSTRREAYRLGFRGAPLVFRREAWRRRVSEKAWRRGARDGRAYRAEKVQKRAQYLAMAEALKTSKTDIAGGLSLPPDKDGGESEAGFRLGRVVHDGGTYLIVEDSSGRRFDLTKERLARHLRLLTGKGA